MEWTSVREARNHAMNGGESLRCRIHVPLVQGGMLICGVSGRRLGLSRIYLELHRYRCVPAKKFIPIRLRLPRERPLPETDCVTQ